MWFDHLRAVAKINFVAIVVRRVVAGSDYDPRARVQMTNGKRKLRNRTRTIEHKRVATIFGCDFRRQLGEFFREKSRIMRDHDFWLRQNSLAPVPVVQVSNKSARCSIDIKEIHRIRADAREFRSLAFARIPAFRSRDNFPDSASAQPTRAKCKCLVKPVVQFLPLSGIDEFLDGSKREV